MAKPPATQVASCSPRYVIVWKEFKLDPKYAQYASRVIPYIDFFKFDVTEELMDKLAQRISVQRPGHAISYV